MELMLDSANLNEIREIRGLGLLDGLTTNPIIIKRGIQEVGYSGDFIDYAKKILEMTENIPVFFQVISHSESEIVTNAERIYQKLCKYGNINIKVPVDTSQKDEDSKYEGIKAIRKLSEKNIPVLATAIVTPVQAFLASRAGAKYVALMLRNYDNIIAERLKLEDLGEEGYLDDTKVLRELIKSGQKLDTYLSGIDTLARASKIFKNHKLETKLIIAGIRNQIQVSTILERGGISAITLPYKVFVSLFSCVGHTHFTPVIFNR